jgi:GDP-4-dehydro-6-deoxy-D-mannose reductase
MRAIVTGAGGFAGRRLATALRESGWTVLTLSRRGPADRVGDLARMPLRGLSADVVFHLAAFSNPSASVGHERETFEANVSATARLLQEVKAGRFVLAGSCQVYAPSPRPIPETGRLLPRTPYAASKLCAEAVARASGREVVLLRPFNHTGPGQSAAYVCPRIARQIARAEAGRGPATLELGEVDHRRDFFDVQDAVRAYVLAAERGRPGEVYNVGTGRPVAIREIVALLRDRARVRLRVRAKPGPSTVLSADASKFRSHTGWRPRIPLSRTLEDLLEYERSRRPIASP